jgi:predicted ribosome quality control (RQC) complex YloA/Tae2 family protein
LERQPDFGLKDAKLLRYGRHFRLPSGVKAIVGRNQEENGIIERMATTGDAGL